MREIIILECTECKRRNYTTTKEKKNTPGRFEIKKFCKFEYLYLYLGLLFLILVDLIFMRFFVML